MKKNIDVMIKKTREAMKNAYAPYSRFVVGACVRTTNDQLFLSGNVENASYALSICAEAGAIIQMIAQGEREIAEVVVMCETNQLCPPCGACRQRIREFASPQTLIHLCTNEGIQKSMTIDELLPLSFGKEILPG